MTRVVCTILLAAAWTGTATAYAPDPPPGVPGPVRYAAYDYVVPALAKRDAPRLHLRKGQRIPHWWFRCHVPAHGERHCVMFKR